MPARIWLLIGVVCILCVGCAAEKPTPTESQPPAHAIATATETPSPAASQTAVSPSSTATPTASKTAAPTVTDTPTPVPTATVGPLGRRPRNIEWRAEPDLYLSLEPWQPVTLPMDELLNDARFDPTTAAGVRKSSCPVLSGGLTWGDRTL